MPHDSAPRSPLFSPLAPTAELTARYDWHLLRHGHVHRFTHRDRLFEALARLDGLGYRTRTAAAGDWTEVSQLHDQLAELLEFSPHYGRNLDALDEELAGLAYRRLTPRQEEGAATETRAETERGAPPPSGTVLALTDFDGFAARFPRAAHALLDGFATRAREGLLVAHPMLCLLEARQPYQAVGATPVTPH